MSEQLLSQIATLRERLLDTTTRNRLVSYPHPARGCARFVGIELDVVFEQLVAGKPIPIEPVPEPTRRDAEDYWRAQGRLDAVEHIPAEKWARHARIDTDYELARGAGRGPLRTLHYRESQEALLRRIRSSARSAIEESGANLLFMAFGFLEWREVAPSPRSHLAPLLLVPVEVSLARDRAGHPVFHVAWTSEDLQWNRSIGRRLELDHGRLLPEYVVAEDGLLEAPAQYLSRVLRAVEGLEGWTVRPFLTLGLFDFGAFLLWRDLDPTNWPETDRLETRPLLRQLLGAESAPPTPPTVPDERIDEHIDLDLALVDKADGSQARALLRALAGETMLIEGPPGTGKSQTITNLIAAALDQGKRVLFVSEKLAALDVVRRRLDALGLAEFCLDLHSERARKRALLDDVERALKRRRPGPAGRAELDAHLEEQRRTWTELAEYGEALLAVQDGTRQPVHRILQRAAILREQANEAGLINAVNGLGVDATGFAELDHTRARAALQAIAPTMAALGCPASQHPWAGIDGTRVRLFERDQIAALLEQWRDAAREVEAQNVEVTRVTGWSSSACGSRAEQCAAAISTLQQWRDILQCLDRAGRALVEIGQLIGQDLRLCALDLRLATVVVERAQAAPFDLLGHRTAHYANSTIDQVLDELHGRLQKAAETSTVAAETFRFPAAWREDPTKLRDAARTLHAAGLFGFLRSDVRSARKLIRRLCPAVQPRDASAPLLQLADAINARNNARQFEAAAKMLGSSFRGLETDVAALRSLRRWVRDTLCDLTKLDAPQLGDRLWRLESEQLRAISSHLPAIAPLAQLIQQAGVAHEKDLFELLLESFIPVEFRSLCHSGTELDTTLNILQSYLDADKKLAASRRAFTERVGLDHALWFGGRDLPPALNEEIERSERALAERDRVREWLAYDLVRRQAVGPVVQHIVAAAEAGLLPSDRLMLAFEYLVAERLAARAMDRYPVLRTHLGITLASLVKRFAELDEEIMEARREAIAARLRSIFVPPGVDAIRTADLTEAALLRHEISKQRRHLPIRRLIERAGAALQSLKPCFMMGPYAVAQYLPPSSIRFDLLIIDEASQLKPEESLGILARCNQAVIVGDTKQLPPTSFFDRVVYEDGDEEEGNVADTAESIMEIAQRRLRDPAMLNWHYRSRHESLVAWSNNEFYGGALIVLPSAHGADNRYGIGWHHVADGTYRAGRNEREAQAVVDAVIEHLASASSRSLGVAAMNVKQAELIEELIDRRVTNERPDLIERLDRVRAGAEPLFVKNLENLQGDERDVMIISLTYGPETVGGKVAQRFGPINRETGWRRLNVLFTRARERMEVFACMRSTDVVAQGSRRGIQALNSFLSYVETGRFPIRSGVIGEPENDFEVEVKRALEAGGFLCDAQVGFAGFRIDIAVRDPEAPDRYALAVECDGATYHSSRSARERDRLRQDILEGLGWKVLRIWSTDWFDDPKREIERIRKRLQTILDERRDRDLPSPAISSDTPELPLGPAGPATFAPSHAPSVRQATASEVRVPVGGRTPEDVRDELIRLREDVIHAKRPDADRSRGLLRKSMLDALLRHRPTNAEEFRRRIPEPLRARTDPEEFREYSDRVFDLLEELA